mgnify:CR=1 FL=1
MEILKTLMTRLGIKQKPLVEITGREALPPSPPVEHKG